MLNDVKHCSTLLNIKKTTYSSLFFFTSSAKSLNIKVWKGKKQTLSPSQGGTQA
jgi:hypothetical protein